MFQGGVGYPTKRCLEVKKYSDKVTNESGKVVTGKLDKSCYYEMVKIKAN